MAKQTAPPPPAPPAPPMQFDPDTGAPIAQGAPIPPPPPPGAGVTIERTIIDPTPLPDPRRDRRIGLGLPVNVTLGDCVRAAIVTHVNPEEQSIIATVFMPNETLAGVGFPKSVSGSPEEHRWHWPDWM